MHASAKYIAVIGVLFSGAIFGFFYAWVCSTMWGLDAIDPRIAIAAMNGMNESVRNTTFAPAFFGTPLVLAMAAGALWLAAQRSAAICFGAAVLIYLALGMALTISINVPMNRALLLVEIPQDIAQAQTMWEAYSTKWQFWNQARTIASGVSFALAAYGLTRVSDRA